MNASTVICFPMSDRLKAEFSGHDHGDSLAVKLLSDAGLMIPGGEQRSYQYGLPHHVNPNRARVYRLDQQRIEGG